MDDVTLDVKAWLSARRDRVEAWLRIRHEAMDGPPSLKEAMGYSLFAGGKRLRPVLAVGAAEACGAGAVEEAGAEALRDYACALEMVHTYSLIHDDLPILDDDDLRRGRPTNHKVYGEPMALLAGDALLTQAFALLGARRGRADGAVRARLVGRLGDAAGPAGMVGGQVLDVARSAVGRGLEAVQEVHRLKTGALIAAACAGGAEAVSAPESAVDALEAYGWRLGLAFQVVDDLLDETGDAAALGKAVGKDAERDTATVPRAIGLSAARELAARLTDEAVEALSPLGGAADPLRALARHVLERSA